MASVRLVAGVQPRLISKTGKISNVLFPGQYMTLLEKASDERFRNTIIILFETGMRYAELASITQGVYDERSGKIRIRTGKNESVYRERWITLTPNARKAVQWWIANGIKPMSRIAYNERLKKMGMYYFGVPISAKCSRKTCENWMRAINIDSMVVCTQLGHTPDTAYRHYCENNPFVETDLEEIRLIFEQGL